MYFSPEKKRMVVSPIAFDDRFAFRWRKTVPQGLIDGCLYVADVFIVKLYEMMGWDAQTTYTAQARYVETYCGQTVVFDLNGAEPSPGDGVSRLRAEADQ